MKVCFQVEGAVDRRALIEIVEVALGDEVEPVVYRRRSGGVSEVFKTLEPSLWEAWRLGCVGAVVGVDANGSTRHDDHAPDAPDDCRHCRMVREIPKLKPRYSQPDLAFAVAIPVETIEAWLIHLRDRSAAPRVRAPHRLRRRKAKEVLWGTLTPDSHTVDIVCDGIFTGLTTADLDVLASKQPSFARFLSNLRSWPLDAPPT